MSETAARTLVKDGEWQVPPAERPRGWESMKARDPWVATQAPPFQQPAPTVTEPETAAEPTLLEQAIAATPAAVAEEPCWCGKPQRHAGACRGVPENSRRAWSEIRPEIIRSAEEFGAEPPILRAALVLIALLCTRGHFRYALRLVTPEGITRRFADDVAFRYKRMGVLSNDGAVYLGQDENNEYGDFEFWMIAMAGAGEIQCRVKDGKSLFAANGVRF